MKSCIPHKLNWHRELLNIWKELIRYISHLKLSNSTVKVSSWSTLAITLRTQVCIWSTHTVCMTPSFPFHGTSSLWIHSAGHGKSAQLYSTVRMHWDGYLMFYIGNIWIRRFIKSSSWEVESTWDFGHKTPWEIDSIHGLTFANSTYWPRTIKTLLIQLRKKTSWQSKVNLSMSSKFNWTTMSIMLSWFKMRPSISWRKVPFTSQKFLRW